MEEKKKDTDYDAFSIHRGMKGVAYFNNSKTPMPFHISRQCHAPKLFHLSRIYF